MKQFNARSNSTAGKYRTINKKTLLDRYSNRFVTGMEDAYGQSPGGRRSRQEGFTRNDRSAMNRSHGYAGNDAASSVGRRIVDGTSEKELMKAMSTYLNTTGAADYNLP